MNYSKRILIVCARVPFPIVDGGAHAIYTLIKSLNQQGHQLHIVSYDSTKHLQDPKGIEPFGKIVTQKKVNRPYGPFDLLKSMVIRKPASIFARFDSNIFESMLTEVETNEFDIIFYAGLQTCAHLQTLKNKYPLAQHILYQVNIEYLLYSRIANAQRSWLHKWAYRMQAHFMRDFEFDSIKKVDKILFISSNDEFHFKHTLRSIQSISLLPPSLKSPIKIDSNQIGAPICAFANWDWAPNYQGLDWFLDNVWPMLIMKEPSIKLNIAGRHMSTSQQKRIRETANIEYVGFVEDLKAFMESSSVMIAPLISGSGIKIKIVEALAHALPFVTTNVGFEGFGDSFLSDVAVDDTPEGFADKLLALKNNSNLNYKVREYMYEFATRNLELNQYSNKINDFVCN